MQGVAWTFYEIGDYYMVALPGEGQGSQLSVLFHKNDTATAVPVSDTIDTGTAVTMLMMDPMAPGNIWAAFADGSLGYYNCTIIIDLPAEVTIDVPVHQQLYSGKVRFEGRFNDEHENILWAKLRIDDGEWQDADLEGNMWWYEVDTDLLESGPHEIIVEVFDGRHKTRWIEFFVTPHDTNDDDDEWPPGIPQIPMLIIAIVIVVYLLWRRSRRTDDEDDQSVPPSP